MLAPRSRAPQIYHAALHARGSGKPQKRGYGRQSWRPRTLSPARRAARRGRLAHPRQAARAVPRADRLLRHRLPEPGHYLLWPGSLPDGQPRPGRQHVFRVHPLQRRLLLDLLCHCHRRRVRRQPGARLTLHDRGRERVGVWGPDLVACMRRSGRQAPRPRATPLHVRREPSPALCNCTQRAAAACVLLPWPA